MINFFKKIFILIVAISICPNTFVYADNNEDLYLKEHKMIVESLGENLSYSPKTGNIDIDYLYQMIHHNKSAIDMAKNLLNNDDANEEVDQVAKDIIKNYSIRIAIMEELMNSLIDNLKENKQKEDAYLKEYDTAVKDMISKFESFQSTNNMYKDFLQTMIIYNEGAIGFSTIVVKHTDNVDIKKLAEEIVKNQQLEIDNIKKISSDIKEDKKSENENTEEPKENTENKEIEENENNLEIKENENNDEKN